MRRSYEPIFGQKDNDTNVCRPGKMKKGFAGLKSTKLPPTILV
jgi:hypothetical protein